MSDHSSMLDEGQTHPTYTAGGNEEQKSTIGKHEKAMHVAPGRIANVYEYKSSTKMSKVQVAAHTALCSARPFSRIGRLERCYVSFSK